MAGFSRLESNLSRDVILYTCHVATILGNKLISPENQLTIQSPENTLDVSMY